LLGTHNVAVSILKNTVSEHYQEKLMVLLQLFSQDSKNHRPRRAENELETNDTKYSPDNYNYNVSLNYTHTQT